MTPRSAAALTRTLASVLAACLALAPLRAQPNPAWTEPVAPFRIADNLYYVGSAGLASYLVTTPQGHILINSSLVESVPLIRASVERLGFRLTDIRILLISHAHWDHNAGSDAIKRLTGASYQVMDADVAVVETGGGADFSYGNTPSTHYPSTTVDRVLHDGDEVRLGDAVLVARLTPGHTKGCTTWTMRVRDGDAMRDAVIVCSPNVNAGYRLVNNPAYPEIAADYERMFRILRSLPCDIFLGAHGGYFGMDAKVRRAATEGTAAFVDPDGYRAYLAEREETFRKELARQRGAPPVPNR